MNCATACLVPLFAASFAVQQLLEILGSILDVNTGAGFEKYKKAVMGIVSFIAGLVLAINVPEVRVLKSFGITSSFDIWVTGLVLSAGTEGANSILKFLKYSKEAKKSTAAAQTPTGTSGTQGIPTEEALKKMNLK